MDSLTQLALGAGVGLAVLGPRVGPRRAALVGAVLGTLPDLDVVVPFDDPVDDFTLHRGPSHSLFVHAVVTPLFGEALMRLFKDLRGERLRAYLGVYLCFATHALIDAATIYGTRIFWPLWPEP
ncbi:MAG: metal-dependent hydrolase, partial [Kiloniellales bacterium]|nr:metal-dependent hydrolase [Kiloniellales bacterium]